MPNNEMITDDNVENIIEMMKMNGEYICNQTWTLQQML
jgi:hypothetical protein